LKVIAELRKSKFVEVSTIVKATGLDKPTITRNLYDLKKVGIALQQPGTTIWCINEDAVIED
jgi:DNA-binding IclR family transcriptional regulator